MALKTGKRCEMCPRQSYENAGFLSPSALMCRLVAAHLLGLRVRIPQRACIFFSCVLYVVQVQGPATGRSPRPEESYQVCVCACLRACVCVCVCELLRVIRCNNNALNLN